MDNYTIIQDKEKLIQFIDWLPELKDNEQYYISLLARKKYAPDEVKADKAQLKRFTSKKIFIYDKIKQLECELGSYKQDGKSMSQEALALYITINPRDLTKAGLNLMVKIAQLTRDKADYYNPHQEALSAIQTSCTRKIYYDIDIDENDPERLKTIFSEIKSSINEDCLTFIKTRGGGHLLVELNKISKEYKSTWYKSLSKFGDVMGDNLVPIPGCTQGLYVPHFLKI